MAAISVTAAQPAGDTGGTQDAARLLLRVVPGVLILLHGITKINGGPAFILDIVDKAWLPEPFGYLVYVGEVLAPARHRSRTLPPASGHRGCACAVARFVRRHRG